MLAISDHQLVQIVDSALLDATRKSGTWLVCKPGCSQCCIGAFAINQLDAARLRDGLQLLTLRDPERAFKLQQRVAASQARMSPEFPGDVRSGLLSEEPQAQERFEIFANDETCPVLDPATGTCDLYEFRPMTCRVFGPPVRSEEGLGVCELCFHGATPKEIAACEMVPDPDDLEAALVKQLEQTTGASGTTIVAFALA
jgi:Fe-S-cluster containining protein